MEQTSDKSPVLRESVMALFTEQKVDHENRPRFSEVVNANSIKIVKNLTIDKNKGIKWEK